MYIIISICIHILVIKQQLKIICTVCNIYYLCKLLLFNNIKLVYKINIMLSIHQN